MEFTCSSFSGSHHIMALALSFVTLGFLFLAGLALAAGKEFPEFSATVMTRNFARTTIFELASPLTTQIALSRLRGNTPA